MDTHIHVEGIYIYIKRVKAFSLKAVGMTVPKSRETSAVCSYMQQHRG